MKNLTLSNIIAATHGEYHGPADILDRVIAAVTTDSRAVAAGADTKGATAAKSACGTGVAGKAVIGWLKCAAKPVKYGESPTCSSSPPCSGADKYNSACGVIIAK